LSVAIWENNDPFNLVVYIGRRIQYVVADRCAVALNEQSYFQAKFSTEKGFATINAIRRATPLLITVIANKFMSRRTTESAKGPWMSYCEVSHF